MGNDTPLRYAFFAPALFGISLFAAGLGILALGLPDDIAHAISSIIVLAVMAVSYTHLKTFSFGIRNANTGDGDSSTRINVTYHTDTHEFEEVDVQ